MLKGKIYFTFIQFAIIYQMHRRLHNAFLKITITKTIIKDEELLTCRGISFFHNKDGKAIYTQFPIFPVELL